MIFFLMFTLALNTSHRLGDIALITKVVGKTLDKAIDDLGLKRDSFRLGGSFDNEILQYCSFLDENNNSVYLWLDVKDVKLPHFLLSPDPDGERSAIFKDNLNTKITFVSVINTQKVEKLVKTSSLPPLNAYSGVKVKEILDSLELKIKDGVGFDDYKHSVYLVRVMDDRGLVFEFQIPKDAQKICEKDINYINLIDCKFTRLRVYTGKENEILRRLIIEISGRFR